MMEIIVIAAWLAVIWLFICNQRTFKDRGKLIDEIDAEVGRRIEAEEYDRYLEPFNKLDRASYHKHLWYRITFRNPVRLYS